MGERMTLDDARRAHEKDLMDMPNVIGVGLGQKDGKDVIKVFVTHNVPESALRQGEVVPKTLEGYETDVEEIGVVTAQVR